MREIDLWCSSCMVALEGREPVGVLLGAKRAEATRVVDVRVHPDHRRRGHGRHLLTSLGQKLAILGPPRLVAEVPAERIGARALFAACRWLDETALTDWHRDAVARAAPAADLPVAPIVFAEALASGLLPDASRCWARQLPALARRAEALTGLGFHSPERLEACVFTSDEIASETAGGARELVAVGATDGEIGRLALQVLLDELVRRDAGSSLRLSRVAAGELGAGRLAELGFRPGAEYRLLATEARAA